MDWERLPEKCPECGKSVTTSPVRIGLEADELGWRWKDSVEIVLSTCAECLWSRIEWWRRDKCTSVRGDCRLDHSRRLARGLVLDTDSEIDLETDRPTAIMPFGSRW
jgi:hypothetical protein